MTRVKRLLRASAAIIAVLPMAALSGNQDPINAAKQADKLAGFKVPGIEDPRAIAEEPMHGWGIKC